MNITASKGYSGSNIVFRDAANVWFALLQDLRLLSLSLIIVLSAISLIYIKDLYRRLYIEYNDLQTVASVLAVNQGKLLLEESAWGSSARVQNLATSDLRMHVPSMDEIMILNCSDGS